MKCGPSTVKCDSRVALPAWICIYVIDTSGDAAYHRSCPNRPWVINPDPILVRKI